MGMELGTHLRIDPRQLSINIFNYYRCKFAISSHAYETTYSKLHINKEVYLPSFRNES